MKQSQQIRLIFFQQSRYLIVKYFTPALKLWHKSCSKFGQNKLNYFSFPWLSIYVMVTGSNNKQFIMKGDKQCHTILVKKF